MKRCVVVFMVLACTKTAQAPDAGASSAVKAPGGTGGDVTPVYGPNATPDPLAQRFCRAMHGLRNERRTACCGGALTTGLLETECVRTLSQSLQAKAVRIPEDKLAACEATQKAAFEGCDWPGPADDQPPLACATVIEGTLETGARCRSSLECGAGMRCAGVGPTDFGKCAGPGKASSPCAVAVDPLGAYTAQRLDDAHPECQGRCERRHCAAAFEPGKACVSSLQCGANKHCALEAGCLDGALAKEGEACTPGSCEGGLRCIRGACARPHQKGEHCQFDIDCAAACNTDGGSCAPRCR
jgi:hypothetical protein